MPISSSLERRAAPAKVARSMLIVEDDATVSLLIEMFAAELGWQVAGVAYTVAQAFNLLERLSPSIAVLDIELGRATSVGVAAACRLRGVPVLFVTGLTAQDVPRECGNDPVLPKPFSENEFERALSRCGVPTEIAFDGR
jgi:DNA-binding response OmpR family regulator